MRFQAHQRVWFKSQLSEKTFRGFVVRPLKDGFYLVDDGTGKCPRVIHEDRLGSPQIKTSGVFA
jgi:hypothetical protein